MRGSLDTVAAFSGRQLSGYLVTQCMRIQHMQQLSVASFKHDVKTHF